MTEKELREKFHIPLSKRLMFFVPIGVGSLLLSFVLSLLFMKFVDSSFGDALMETIAGTASAVGGAFKYDGKPIPGGNLIRDFDKGAEAVKKLNDSTKNAAKSRSEVIEKTVACVIFSIFLSTAILFGIAKPALESKQLKRHGKNFCLNIDGEDNLEDKGRRFFASGTFADLSAGLSLELAGAWEFVAKKNNPSFYVGKVKLVSTGRPTDQFVNLINDEFEITDNPIEAKPEVVLYGTCRTIPITETKAFVIQLFFEQKPLFDLRMDYASKTICLCESDLYQRIRIVNTLAISSIVPALS